MLTKRLIACFDIVGGRVTKAKQFQDNIDVGGAAELADTVYNDGIDELIFYDITASAERRGIDIKTVKRVAERVFIPFSVGGGIHSLDDMYAVLQAGAEKVSVDSMAVRNPELIRDGAKAFGSQCVVLSTQVKQTGRTQSGYEVFVDGARTATGMDAVDWCRRGQDLGAGELCVNSIHCDGTAGGYDIALMRLVEHAVSLPLIASGGAGTPRHIKELFQSSKVQGAIISSMLYSPRFEHNYTVAEIKRYLAEYNIPIRPHEDTKE